MNWIETVSYALIIVVGLRLLWVKGRAFISALREHGCQDLVLVGAVRRPSLLDLRPDAEGASGFVPRSEPLAH